VIDPSIRAVLSSRYTNRKFFLLYGATLAAVLLILTILTATFQTGSTVRDVSTTFFGNFASAVAIFIATYAFYVFVTPPGHERCRSNSPP